MLLSRAAFGWIDGPRPSASKLVQISDCIVIAHAKNDSLDQPVLVVTEVLKGTPPAKEFPLIYPKTGAYMRLGPDHVLREGGSMPFPLSDDIRKDQIWFLRTDPKGFSDEKPGGSLRIIEPGDVQPVDLKPYYTAFLSNQPEDILRKYLDSDNRTLSRACHAYLDPIDIAQIVKIQDISDRVEKLIPYLLFRESFNPKENDETVPNSETMPTVTNSYNMRDNDAKRQLILCGDVAGDRLVPIFLDPNYEYMRMEIMSMWAEMHYKAATPLVVSLLEQEDKHWEHPDVPHPIDNDRANSWSRLRISCAINTLAALQDPRGVKALLLTKNRWTALRAIDPNPDSIASQCDKALEQIRPQQ